MNSLLKDIKYSKSVIDLSTATLENNKVAIFIVSYNAERHIVSVLSRIPDWVASLLTEIYIIDDCSLDSTVAVAESLTWSTSKAPLKIYRTPFNQGYGGNQKLGYTYAKSNRFDIVVLLHGDGQYAPEYLPYILAEYSKDATTAAVYGSRFMDSLSALKGGMPFYKYIGNRILTYLQNKIIRSNLSELHSGYRSYKVSALELIPFNYNSNGFDFDSDIIIQFTAAKLKIAEVAIPTYYGDEICHVNGMQYAWECIKSAIQYRVMDYELLYDPKFDVKSRDRKYTIKASKTSLHFNIRSLDLKNNTTLLDLGGGDGSAVSTHFANKGIQVTVIDQFITEADDIGVKNNGLNNIKRISADLDGNWTKSLEDIKFDTVFVLDVLEHMKNPERTLKDIQSIMKPGSVIYASTGNISFWVIRFMHLFGFFNYGRRGILDLTHTRLFTVYSFKKLFINSGFIVNEITAFGPPIEDLALTPNLARSFLDLIGYRLARVWKSLFGYQILIKATRSESLDSIINTTFNT